MEGPFMFVLCLLHCIAAILAVCCYYCFVGLVLMLFSVVHFFLSVLPRGTSLSVGLSSRVTILE